MDSAGKWNWMPTKEPAKSKKLDWGRRQSLYATWLGSKGKPENSDRIEWSTARIGARRLPVLLQESVKVLSMARWSSQLLLSSTKVLQGIQSTSWWSSDIDRRASGCDGSPPDGGGCWYDSRWIGGAQLLRTKNSPPRMSFPFGHVREFSSIVFSNVRACSVCGQRERIHVSTLLTE